MRRVLITGTAGFIGYHLARLLLAEGWAVHGYDGMTDYYDVALKRRRHAMLRQNPHFAATEAMLEDQAALAAAFEAAAPEVVVHLAAQAGVRYSLEAPRAYVDSNVTGSFNVLEEARRAGVRHLLLASTSSVYGANPVMPFAEAHKADTPLTIYAATKKAMEAMAHANAHLWGVPTTAFRFFTVYGPWGRPDLALYKFVDAILNDRPIEVYNHGEMWRDFTYIDDLCRAIRLLVDAVPVAGEAVSEADTISPVAPFRVVNIGGGRPVKLTDFVDAIEAALGRPAHRVHLPMQPGDVPATHADTALLEALTGFRPETTVAEGVSRFVAWYRDYHGLPG
jgi:UDP-glucuronate 4-epimerase